MNEKPLSRNKTIKLLRDFTGEPYSVCRRRLKENHWNFNQALGEKIGLDFSGAAKQINELANKFGEFLAVMIEETTKCISSFWEDVSTAIKQMNEPETIERFKKQLNGREIEQIIIDDSETLH